MWKTSRVIPLPKKSGAEELGDFRPIALTPIIMKTLEKIVVKQLLKSVEGTLDTCQFACKQNHSTEDTVVTLLHSETSG